MKVVIVGKGGREHALAEKIKESSLVSELWVCPGNEGMVRSGISCKAIEKNAEVLDFCESQKVNLVILGPESAILSDLKSKLEKKSIPCFAPSLEAGKLEASKIFCKRVLEGAQIATAPWQEVVSREEGLRLIQKHDFAKPLVLKADGLAQGKGVWVCDTRKKAIEGFESLTTQFGFPLLFEECLIGKELSAFALCDGTDFVVLGTACDYKRISPDPFSANTGGMGAYSPCDFLSASDEAQIENIFSKTLHHLNSIGITYQGFLFAGLMKTENSLSVLEFNVRMGDPETQALLPRLKSDLARLVISAVQHELSGMECKLSFQKTVHVVAASQGYPTSNLLLKQPLQMPEKISPQAKIFFAGVAEAQGQLINSGGRVIGVTAFGESKAEARKLAYEVIYGLKFNGMTIREDIGL